MKKYCTTLLPIVLSAIGSPKPVMLMLMSFAALTSCAQASPLSAEHWRLTLSGPLEQGGMVWTQVPAGARASLDGQALNVGANGIVVFGFGRDAKPTAELNVCMERGPCVRNQIKVRQREYRVSRVDGVPQKTVDPPSGERLKRIQNEAQLARTAREKHLARQDFTSAFIWPVTGRISGVFGSQRVYNGRPGRPHYGVDVARPTGTPVVAPADAVVTLVHNNMFYSGGTLIMDHGQGISSTFIHLSKILVAEGQEVKQGDIVAEIGSSGRATGPHLDWRMNWHTVRLDPQLLVGEMNEDR